jgi:ATP-dependent DNA helicase RecG
MRTPYIEKLGTGVLRINQALNEAGLSEAQFSFDEFNFSITLHALQGGSPKSSPKSSPKTADKILALIKKNPAMSTSQIGEQLGITKRAVLKHTSMLKDAGLLRFVGAARSGYWEVMDV